MSLSKQNGLSDLLPLMDVEQIALRVNPETLPWGRDRDVFKLGGRDELLGFHAWNEFANMQMHVALGLNGGGVIRQCPIVAESRFRVFDSGCEEFCAKVGGQLADRTIVHPGQRQPPPRLGGVHIFENERPGLGRLFFGLAT